MKILPAKRQIKSIARLLSAVAMLSLYVIGTAQTGYLHQLLHPEEVAAAHTAKQEQDPCHRSMYHGVDTGCRHEFHLAKKHSCTFLHTLTHSDPALVDTSDVFSIFTGKAKELFPAHEQAIVVTYTFLTRGPPAELLV